MELFIVASTLKIFPYLSALFFILLLCVPFAGFIGRQIAGPLGYILGLALAQVMIFFLQWALFSRQFGASFLIKNNYFRYALKDPGAIAIGFLCAFGVFADKIILVFIGNQFSGFPMFQMTHEYNTAFSLALMAVLPAFILFIMKSEKEIFRRYKNYY